MVDTVVLYSVLRAFESKSLIGRTKNENPLCKRVQFNHFACFAQQLLSRYSSVIRWPQKRIRESVAAILQKTTSSRFCGAPACGLSLPAWLHSKPPAAAFYRLPPRDRNRSSLLESPAPLQKRSLPAAAIFLRAAWPLQCPMHRCCVSFATTLSRCCTAATHARLFLSLSGSTANWCRTRTKNAPTNSLRTPVCRVLSARN